MHYNWPKIEYLGGMKLKVFIIYLYEACAALIGRSFEPGKSGIEQYPHIYLEAPKASATHPPGRVCGTVRMTPATPASVGVVILDFLPPPNSPSEEHTDKARAKYGGARSHPGPQPLRIPNPYNDESSTALHTRFGGFFLPPFEECTDNIHHEIWECTAAQTPTCNLYDNETRMAPHTRFGGDLTLQYPTDECTNQMQGEMQDATHPPKWNTQTMPTPKYGSVLPPKTQTLDHPQVIQQWIKYDATHPPKWVLSPYAKPHPKPAQMKAKAKYGRTQAPESPAPNTHGDRHDKLNMIPYAAAAGLFSHHETSPAQEYIDKAQGEIWVHTQPPKTTLKHLYTTTNRIQCHMPALAGVWQQRAPRRKATYE
ncbi:hypothetical protein BS47DRAFT_1365092 [Hydnum rufescens UP504]|uniref:Uncharacterized protein n=1 Tax=Hydnum rufescens UP504 TaxID=1448309 RepID=A0A9P6APW5_9AGAM|nr:hypothetical protein BS47DRAFT_1365092 [Hydnum rufescens UP504]